MGEAVGISRLQPPTLLRISTHDSVTHGGNKPVQHEPDARHHDGTQLRGAQRMSARQQLRHIHRLQFIPFRDVPSFKLPSYPPLTSNFPSGLKATLLTIPEWALCSTSSGLVMQLVVVVKPAQEIA